MQITVLSKDAFSLYEPNAPAVLMRIADPGEELKPSPYAWEDVLDVRCYDVTDEDCNAHLKGSNLSPLSLQQAKEIVSFFEKHMRCEHWVIHCHAGVSRSPAVALVLSEFLYIHTGKMFAITYCAKPIIPNETVLRRLREACWSGGEGEGD